MSDIKHRIQARNGEVRIMRFTGSESFEHEGTDVWVIFEGNGRDKVGLILPSEQAYALAQKIFSEIQEEDLPIAGDKPEWMQELERK